MNDLNLLNFREAVLNCLESKIKKEDTLMSRYAIDFADTNKESDRAKYLNHKNQKKVLVELRKEIHNVYARGEWRAKEVENKRTKLGS